LNGLEVFFIGGGDTFAVAEALGSVGAEAVHRFVTEGGIYFGACAGAYLLLDLTGPPFEPFAGFTAVGLANVSPTLPACTCMPTKFHSSYHNAFVVHPAREALLLRTENSPLFHAEDTLVAPLYGGPAMVPSPEETAFAWYSGVTEDALLLGSQGLVEQMFYEKAAVVRKSLGQGVLWLFGPHCEHPGFPAANRSMINALYSELGRLPFKARDTGTGWTDFAGENHMDSAKLKTLKKDLSNARIVALGMESRGIHWRIGKKTYEPEKIRVFLEAVWPRLAWLLKQSSGWCPERKMNDILQHYQGLDAAIKSLAEAVSSGEETTNRATRLFERLRNGTACFLSVYFRNRFLQARTE